MATAVEPGSQPRTPSLAKSLPLASVLGALYVLASLAVVLFAIPNVWNARIDPALNNYTLSGLLRVATQFGLLGGLVWFGRKILGDNPPRGIHGGIFLVISWAIGIFFLWRAIALGIEGPAGMIASGVFAAFLLYLAVKNITGKRGQAWMVSLEEQGWFTTAPYKRTLGQRARRLTILGFLLIGGTGLWALDPQNALPETWTLAMPFDSPSRITILPDAQITIPVLLVGFMIWFAWRAVNIPTFAEFLIATEAEMNKVSWTPKKRLAQDTVVVLTTTLLLALFLLVVDLFWGWLLSTVGVLPSRGSGQDHANPAQQARW
ncbi:MAG TPA: preprotein translocase subunit SecE [Gemmata sp.]|nr:preprotein translocase subunit SecE [Gemmata sp.]